MVTKLSDRTINGELLKYLAKTANDEQPGIRTNTTICLGKIAKYLGSSSRSKVLIAAFTRSLRDPFVHARNASLMALAATGEYFNEEESAVRVLPALCPLLIDKEKMIRDQTTKTMDVFMQKICKAASSMPDTVLPPPPSGLETSGVPPPRMSTPQPSEASSSSWAGWAISSFTNTLSTAAGEIQANGTGVASPRLATTSLAPGRMGAPTLHKQLETIKSPPLTPMSRTSSTGANAAALFQGDDDDDDADEGAGAWGDVGDDSFFDAPEDETSYKPAAPSKELPVMTSYDDGGEPDFAGWLAAQSQKKQTGTNKPLPKGLAKSKRPASSTITKKAAVASKSTTKPVVAKKIDLKPKEDDGDDGWGDGW